MKRDNLEEVFSPLKSYSSAPPPELWDAIESRLEKPKKKKRAIIWWYVAAGMAVGLLIPSVYLATRLDHLNKKNNVVLQLDEALLNDPLKQDVNPETKFDLINKSNEIVSSTLVQAQASGLSEQVSKQSQESLKFTNQHKSENRLISQIRQESDDFTVSSTHQIKESIMPEFKEVASIQTKVKLKQQGLSDSLVIQKELLELENILAQGNTTEDTPEPKENLIGDKWSVQVFAGLPNAQQNKNNEAEAITTNKSNTFGVKTNYQINKKWLLRAGVKWNDLGSETQKNISSPSHFNSYAVVDNNPPITQVPQPTQPTYSDPVYSNNNSDQVVLLPEHQASSIVSYAPDSDTPKNDAPLLGNSKTENKSQQLRYIEFPVEVSYFIMEAKRTNIRVNTGGVLGKMVGNKTYVNGEVSGSNPQVNDYIYGVLFSSTVQYKIFKQMYLFAEPGMNYYLKPIEYQTYSRLNPILNMGINVTF